MADFALLGPAFLAGLLVLSTHVPLGREVLTRGIIFIDLAVAQMAALGPIAASLAGRDEHGLAAQLTAVAAALLGAAILWGAERLWPDIQEAVIGVFFVLAACAAILLLAGNPHGGEHLKELLVGQILWAGYADLAAPALVYSGLLGLWLFAPLQQRGSMFYPIFAVAVTLSVQLVGVYLVFASLILPALAVRGRHGGIWSGLAVGAIGYSAGLVLSMLWDLPAGALIVWALAVTTATWRGICSVMLSESANGSG